MTAFIIGFFLPPYLFGWFGRLFYMIGLKKVGFRLMCMSIAPNPVRDSELPDLCVFDRKKCDSCRMWTCPYYKKKENE